MLTDAEFEGIMADMTKRVVGDLMWQEDRDHVPVVEFRAEVASEAGYPLIVIGRYHSRWRRCSYGLIHRDAGRIFALEVGTNHHNLSCQKVGGKKHRHYWSEQFGDGQAYRADDLTSADPLAVWRQFCVDTRMTHDGTLHAP